MRISCALLALLMLASPALARIERVWLTFRSTAPDKIVVNWESTEPGDSVVHFGRTADYDKRAEVKGNARLHHVEIPLDDKAEPWHYSVSTGDQSSPDAAIKAIPRDELRVAVVADWQGKPNLDALLKDDVHILMTAGDNIDSLHRLCGVGVRDCTKPYAELIDKYPELFRSTPFMPVLGNHDREIRPRGDKPPAEAVYDVDATAFRRFFALPDEQWKWRFDVPAMGIRFIALDLNHTSDMGTTWQTCHPFDKDSEQLNWYEGLMTGRDAGPLPPFVITLYNERNGTVRSFEKGQWHQLISRGTVAITGFGYFAERAVADGFPYYNSSLSGKGAKYPDAKSQFFASEDSYMLLTLGGAPRRLRVEIKSLEGKVLDAAEYPAKAR